MKFSRPKAFRAMMLRVTTMANPEKIAPATKYGGKIVLCQPGRRLVAKSVLTTLCTDRTSGVDIPAYSR